MHGAQIVAKRSSGRARQQYRKTTCYGWFCFLPNEITQRIKPEIWYRAAKAIVAVCFKEA